MRSHGLASSLVWKNTGLSLPPQLRCGLQPMAALLTDPNALVIVTAYCPTSLACTFGSASVLPVAPLTTVPFRRHSYFSDIAVGTITGLGPMSYELALRAALQRLNTAT